MAARVCASSDEAVLNAIFNPHEPLVNHDNLKEIEVARPIHNITISDNLKKLEIDAVNFAQDGDLIASLNAFNKLIKEVPEYASAYNNRAQLFRLQGDNESALEDLNKAISLSDEEGFAASQAFVQRALLHKLNKDDTKAIEDFKSAARLGNKFAECQLTAMNPYAALCNQMLSEVFSKVCKGEPDME